MSIHSAYDEMLEDQQCPNCGTVGMQPDSGVDWLCPECGYEGTFEEDEDEED